MPPSETVQLFIDALAGTFPDVGGDCIDPVEARRILAERPEIPLPPIEVASVEDTHHPRSRRARSRSGSTRPTA